MRKPRTVARAAVAVGTALVLAACGGSPTSPSAGGSNNTEASGPTDAEQLYEELAGLSGQERRDRLVELAAEEDGLNVYTSLNAKVVEAVMDAFEEEFDIEPSVYRASGETILQRILQESDAGYAGNDVVETNSGELGVLQQEGLLTQCIAQELVDQVPDAGRAEGWTATRFNIFAPSWNTDIITEPPTSWEDLADPKYDGQLVLEIGDYDWYMGLSDYWLEEGKSQEEIDQLWADMVDGGRVVKGHSVAAELMGAGQFGVAAANYTYIVDKAKAAGSPIEQEPFVSPLIARANGGGCMNTAQNPASAMLFMDWMLEGGQAIIAEQNLTPAISEGDALGADDLIAIDPQKLLEEGQEWSEKYDELLSGAEKIG